QSYIAHARKSRRPSPSLSSSFLIYAAFIRVYLWPLSVAFFRERQRIRGTGGMTCGVARIHAMSRSHTTCSCGSHDGRLCQPLPPGKREERTVPTVAGSFVSTPVLNDARHVTPSAGTPMETARHRP